jgi:hypothetical protein
MIGVCIKILSFCMFTMMNSYMIEGFNIPFLRTISFIFIEALLVIAFIGWNDNHEYRYRQVVFENINLYNRLMRLEEEKKESTFLKKDIEIQTKNMIENTLVRYQEKIGYCLFPFCENKSDGLCLTHKKYSTEECAVCYEGFTEGFYPLSCGHYIHKECYQKLETKKCPYCKEENDYFR